MAISKITRPMLEIKIGGEFIDKHPSSFALITDKGLPSVFCRLKYPATVDAGQAGDKITVDLRLGEEVSRLFTGEIYSAGIHGDKRDLALTDDYKKLRDTLVVNAYRKEKAKVILSDALEASGISETAITCPDEKIERYSTDRITASDTITLLIKALEEYGHYGLRFFFDERNMFRFGTREDTGKNEGEAYVFESGENIIRKGEGKIETLPLPIRHLQKISVDGQPLYPVRTDLFISGLHSRLALYLKESS